MSSLRYVILFVTLLGILLGYSLRDDRLRSFVVELSPAESRLSRRPRHTANATTDRQRSHMGLTDEQYNTVQYYLTKLRELGKLRHPDEGGGGGDGGGGYGSGGGGEGQKLDSEVAKWSKRMRDDIEGEILNPEEYGRHFEGDIILFPDQAKEIYENALRAGNRRVKRKFIGSSLRRWDPTRPIIYGFDGSHTPSRPDQHLQEKKSRNWNQLKSDSPVPFVVGSFFV
ncbi:hypothetical protein KIN20_025350 [Parelaphostrongylus tenuis]|uniref:Uncharacterized protein n=1 Tax=Parelaphostrongylus tenuis TaxID=148309 RepID=A0AAD5MYB8_PARTN|nr:hypothetical protein KIN20_025350 [Parelaphostrongylus tenuis]